MLPEAYQVEEEKPSKFKSALIPVHMCCGQKLYEAMQCLICLQSLNPLNEILGPLWNAGFFSRSCVFSAKNELNPVKFLWNSCKIPVFQKGPYL